MLDKADIVLYNISMINLPINKLLGFGKIIRNKWLYKAKISRWKFMSIEGFPSAPPKQQNMEEWLNNADCSLHRTVKPFSAFYGIRDKNTKNKM